MMEILKKMAAKAENNTDLPGVTLAFLGDSVTQGCFELPERADGGFNNCHDRQHVYSAYVQQILSVLYPTVPVNIINAGVAGKDAVHGLARLERDVLSHGPDLTVVCFALNDSGNGEKGLGAYVDSLEQIFDSLRSAGSEIIFMTPNTMATHVSPLLKLPLFRELAEIFSRRQLEGGLDRYVEAAKNLCRSRSIPVCDCYAIWKKLEMSGVNTTELLANKLNHPTRQMHWMFAYELVRTMLEA